MPAADTLVIQRNASHDSPPVARFVFERNGAFSWTYVLDTDEPGLVSNALEFGYEVQGLPIDSVAADEWVRVIYGRTQAGEHRRGWVSSASGRATVRLWADVLRQQSLFFIGAAEDVAFYDGPAGDRVRFDLAPSGAGGWLPFDHRMKPLEVDGRWMKVRVSTPSGACKVEKVESREAVLWIEYLDERGRPRVWYNTRGC